MTDFESKLRDLIAFRRGHKKPLYVEIIELINQELIGEDEKEDYKSCGRWDYELNSRFGGRNELRQEQRKKLGVDV